MSKKRIFIIFSILISLVVVTTGGAFLYYIKTPVILADMNTYVDTDGWSNVSNDIKPITKSIEITNLAENGEDVYVRVINTRGELLVEPQIIECGQSKLLTDKLNVFKEPRVVQVKAIKENKYYKFTAKHGVE